MVENIYAGILMGKHTVTEKLFDDKHGALSRLKSWLQINEQKSRRKRVYVDFVDLKNTCDRDNRKTIRQVLNMNDVGGKLLSGIKSMYFNSLAVRKGEISHLKLIVI